MKFIFLLGIILIGISLNVSAQNQETIRSDTILKSDIPSVSKAVQSGTKLNSHNNANSLYPILNTLTLGGAFVFGLFSVSMFVKANEDEPFTNEEVYKKQGQKDAIIAGVFLASCLVVQIWHSSVTSQRASGMAKNDIKLDNVFLAIKPSSIDLGLQIRF